MGGIRRSDPSQSGQATVEFAIITPLIVLALLAVVQVGLVMYAQLAVMHTAREVARMAVVDPEAQVVHWTSTSPGHGSQDLVRTITIDRNVEASGPIVTVVVEYQVPPVTRVFATFSDRFVVRSTVKMGAER